MGGGPRGVFGTGIFGSQLDEAIKKSIENSPEYQRQQLLKQEKERAAQEDANKKASLDLTNALSKQKQFAAKAQGKGGTLLTSSLGVVDQQSQTGQKTLLGL